MDGIGSETTNPTVNEMGDLVPQTEEYYVYNSLCWHERRQRRKQIWRSSGNNGVGEIVILAGRHRFGNSVVWFPDTESLSF